MKNKKYPANLFLIGFFMNLSRNFYLLLPSVILIVIGFWNLPCLVIGVLLFVIDVIKSFIEQLKIKYTCEVSDNPDFLSWQNAILDENWRKNLQEMLDEKINDSNDGEN